MKNLINIILIIIFVNAKISAQCTTPTNNQVDFAAVSIDAVKGTITVGEVTTIEALFQNNISGTSAFIPTGDARITISIPTNVTFEMGTFTSSTGLFTITSINATTIQIRNTGGNWSRGSDEIITFDIKGATVTSAMPSNNIAVASSLGPVSNCGDINGANQSVSGTIIVNSSPLPLSLISFNGKHFEGENLLNWKTSDEKNVAYFEIQNSTNLSEFAVIGKVTALNNKGSFYNFLHKTPILNAISYYRLKMVDNDGSYKYSNIININASEEENYVSVENPAINGTFKIISNLPQPRFILFNALGEQINLQVSKTNNNNYTLNSSNSIKGIYYLNIISQNNLTTKKVLFY